MVNIKYSVSVKRYKDNVYQIKIRSSKVTYGEASPLVGTKRKTWEDKAKYMDLNGITRCIKKSLYLSAKRSKDKIYDYARSNDWEWFLTFTFNPEKADSLNYDLCKKKLSEWLKNVRKRQCPDMKYLIVPELHKSGRIHFHGIFTDINELTFIDSGHKTKKGDTIYNLENYGLGFTTATKVKDTHSVSLYIGKYITKELASATRNKKRYWVSRNLNKPTIEYHDVSMFAHLDLHDKILQDDRLCYLKEITYQNDNGNQYVRYYELNPNMPSYQHKAPAYITDKDKQIIYNPKLLS